MRTQKKYQGVIVPMMTPFTARHMVDESAAGRLADHIISHGTQPFILGTTGEGVSVPLEEKTRMVTATVKAADERSPVYVGISGNSLRDSLEEGKRFHDLGATVLVATMPSYYPVQPDQMLRYFEALADALPCPLIIYNIPATTHLSIPLEIVDQLSMHANIAGLKDSEKDMERITTAARLWKHRPDFSFLCGWAVMSQAALEQGADGIVPSSGNLIPAVYQAIVNGVQSGDPELAAAAQTKADLVSETYQKGRILSQSLSAFKAILAAYKLCDAYMLPPLYQLPEAEELLLQQEVPARFGDLRTINSI